ncbi:MAG: hypothetical protein LBS04_02485 [Tannerellaceae bacterium]|nr:hypothetical protein [Tannerellaceae bacterium]
MKWFNKKYLLGFIIFILLVNCFLLYKLSNYKLSIVAYQTILDNDMDKIQKMETLGLHFDTSLRNNGMILNNIFVKDSLNREIQLTDLFKKGKSKIFVSRFSRLCCEDCVVFSIQKAVSMADSTGIDNIVFLGSYENTESLNLLRDQYGLQGKEVYNTVDFLNIPIEESNRPCYFVLDSTLRIFDVFIPEMTSPNITNMYLSIIREKWFKL